MALPSYCPGVESCKLLASLLMESWSFLARPASRRIVTPIVGTAPTWGNQGGRGQKTRSIRVWRESRRYFVELAGEHAAAGVDVPAAAVTPDDRHAQLARQRN